MNKIVIILVIVIIAAVIATVMYKRRQDSFTQSAMNKLNNNIFDFLQRQPVVSEFESAALKDSLTK